jgi:outer membrane receptor protein involved in Fe transport
MKLGWFILCWSCSFVTLAQEHVHINGSVVATDNQEFVADALISVIGSHEHVHTDKLGQFELPITKGTFPIQFTIIAKGFEPLTYSLIKVQQDTLIRIEVIRKETEISEVSIVADKPVSAASSAYFSAVTFANRPRNSAQDLLRIVPGLFIAQHAGGGKAEQIFVRGFDCDHGTDVATYVDGIPVNMPSHGHGQGYADLHFLIPDVVAGISVYKGTSFAQFGDFSTGASVAFKTLDTLSSNVIQYEMGGVATKKAITSQRLLFMVQLPFESKKVQSYFASDIQYNAGCFDVNQAMNRFNVFHKTTVQLTQSSSLQFSFSGFSSDWNASGQIPERAVRNGLISRYGSIDPHEGGTTQRTNYNIHFSQKIKGGTLDLQSYACQYRFRLFSDFTFFLKDSVNGDMIEQDDKRSITGVNLTYSIVNEFLGKKGKFTVGAQLRSDDIENQLWHAPARERMSQTAHAFIHQRTSGLYAMQQLTLSKKWRADIGLRYDQVLFDVEDMLPTDSNHLNYSGYSSQSGFHPKLNIQYALRNKWMLFFNSGTGFHSNDARSSVQQLAVKHLPLAISSELGSLVQFKQCVLSLALWEMELNNELVFVGDDGTTENKGASRRWGVDCSIRAPFANFFFLDADVNWSKNRLTTNLFQAVLPTAYYIPLAPKLTMSYGLSFKKKSLELSVNVRTMCARPANESNTVIAHGYTVVAMGVTYKKVHWKWNCSIDNVFNVQWNEAQFATETRLKNESQPVEEIHFTPGTPFSLKASIAYLF